MLNEIEVKRLTDDAILPTRSHDDDAGLDLYAREQVVVGKGAPSCCIPTGIAVAIPSGYAGLIWPRSGLSRREGIDVLAGVVDPQYRSEVEVVLALHSADHYYLVEKGDRIAQLVIQPVELPAVREVDELDSTDRGGFGSTGR
jgi:dUTP pyrophosphatase